LESTSPDAIAERLLACCLEGRPWSPEDLRRLVEKDSATLFRVVVEGLGDRFEPGLCDAYARLFSEAIACALPGVDAAELVARYRRIRHSARRVRNAATVFVLSRITLGADVAVTSVLLDAAKRRFPRSRIVFAGPRKNWELFAGDPRIEHLEVAYARRGSLAERLAPWSGMRATLDWPGSIVIDPDSRLTQLGLLPVCPDDNYFFFESRAFGGDGEEPVSALASRWAAETLGVPGARPFVSPAAAPVTSDRPLICVSLGVGENPAKRIADPFEEELLRALAAKGPTVLVDQGAGGEETARVLRAIKRSGAPAGRIRTWKGAFAPFAATIAQAALYVGYDSAAQHVAAACGVPLVTVFAGFVTPRFFARWRPSGPGPIRVIRVDDRDPARVLDETLRAIDTLGMG
jgi:ADP-heptose:LPS heptosyltransferase